MRARARRLLRNRLALAALAGMLVWLADQPTVAGYNPLVQMFWDPGFWRLPTHDALVLIFSWMVTTLFLHFVLFVYARRRERHSLG